MTIEFVGDEISYEERLGSGCHCITCEDLTLFMLGSFSLRTAQAIAEIHDGLPGEHEIIVFDIDDNSEYAPYASNASG